MHGTGRTVPERDLGPDLQFPVIPCVECEGFPVDLIAVGDILAFCPFLYEKSVAKRNEPSEPDMMAPCFTQRDVSDGKTGCPSSGWFIGHRTMIMVVDPRHFSGKRDRFLPGTDPSLFSVITAFRCLMRFRVTQTGPDKRSASAGIRTRVKSSGGF